MQRKASVTLWLHKSFRNYKIILSTILKSNLIETSVDITLSKSKQAKMDSVVKNLNDCVTVFQFLGHFYFSTKNPSVKNRDRRPSLGRTIYFIFLLLFLLSSMFVCAHALKSTDYVKQLTAKTLLDIFFFDAFLVGTVLEIFLGLTQSYWATPLTKRFFLNSLNIAEKFKNDFNYVVDHGKIRKKLIRQTLFLSCYFTGTGFFQYFFSKFHLNESSAEFKNLMIICPILFVTTLVLKFIFHLRIINMQLAELRIVFLEMFPKFTFAGVINGVFVKPVKAKIYQKTTIKLKIISEIYFLIAENAELVNRSMGITVTSITAFNVISLITGTNRILMAALGKNPLKNIAGKHFS